MTNIRRRPFSLSFFRSSPTSLFSLELSQVSLKLLGSTGVSLAENVVIFPSRSVCCLAPLARRSSLLSLTTQRAIDRTMIPLRVCAGALCEGPGHLIENGASVSYVCVGEQGKKSFIFDSLCLAERTDARLHAPERDRAKPAAEEKQEEKN